MQALLHQLELLLNQMTHLGPWFYVVVAGVLLASGFGLPLPEDVPLIAGGVACSVGGLSLWLMIPLCLAAVLGGDCIVYYMGRNYGHHVPRLPLLRRYLTPTRLAGAEASFHAHGGKTIFIARFMPGLRAPLFFTAGIFRIPFWKFVAFDGTAALLSVPAWVLVAYFFAEQLPKIRKWAGITQMGIVAVVVLVVAGVVTVKVLRRRRVASAG